MIFPGMDPYLEDPWLWPSVHGRLILNLADLLNTVIRPDYLAVAEGRTYPEGAKRQPRPDVLDVALDIQEALERTYELGYYREQLDYQKPCVPPLSAEDQAWAETLIRAAGEPAEKSV